MKDYLERIKYFKNLFYKYERNDDFAAFGEFQQFLDLYATTENEAFYNVSDIMTKLAPSCNDFVKICTLGGEIINCDAFETSLTVYGQCCTFTVENKYHLHLYKKRYFGADLGLVVVLNTTHVDDTFSLLNIDGYAVLIHAPYNFPDVLSGNVIEIFPMNNEETFLAMKARSMDANENLRKFSPSQRECYFDDEAPFSSLQQIKPYSLTTCISLCRLRSVVTLCNCVPFFMPYEMRAYFKDVPYCTLNYVECMQRYQFKWRNVLTQRVDIEGLEREIEEALYCPQCLPACDDVRYEISMMSLPTDRYSLPEGIEASSIPYNISDMSVLRVFFGESTSILFKRVIKNTWVEGLSTVGNIVSVCMGFSLVVLFEILYFIVQCIFSSVRGGANKSHNSTRARKKLQLQPPKLHIYP